MTLSRRGLLLAAPGLLTACLHPGARPDLVDAFSAERQRTVLPQGFPVLALYETGSETLGFVAANHTVDPRSMTFRTIRFALETVRPKLVVLEGFPTALGVNPERIVRQARRSGAADANAFERGEAAFAAGLALGGGTPFVGGEPTDAELARKLVAAGFSQDDVFFSSLYGPLGQDFKSGAFSGPAEPGFERSFRRWAGEIARELGRSTPWVQAFRDWHQAAYGVALEDDPIWWERDGPGRPGKAGQISRLQTLLRDRHLHTVLVDAVGRHRRVLTVYGGSHLSTLWRSLEAVMGSPRLMRPPAVSPA